MVYTTIMFLVLMAFWLAVNLGAIFLVGWLGVLTVNLILATSYPWYAGPTLLTMAWVLFGWIRWRIK